MIARKKLSKAATLNSRYEINFQVDCITKKG